MSALGTSVCKMIGSFLLDHSNAVAVWNIARAEVLQIRYKGHYFYAGKITVLKLSVSVT